jgi:hypothetical protein
VEEPLPEGVTDEELIRAAKDRSRDLRLAVGCRGQLKMPTKCYDESRQEYAATIGWPTHHTAPVMHKWHVCRGLGKKCRNGIRGPGRTLGSRMEDRGLQQRRTKDNVL